MGDTRETAFPPLPHGFTGQRGKVIGEARDGAHVVRIVEYVFPDGSRVPYVELHETHDGARPGRVMALSALVHLAQNTTDLEVWAIGNRDQRPAAPSPPAANERAQAERWARQVCSSVWDLMSEADHEREIAAMLPIVREARRGIEALRAHLRTIDVALDHACAPIGPEDGSGLYTADGRVIALGLELTKLRARSAPVTPATDLLAARTALGLTIKQLADAVGYAPETLRRWEATRAPLPKVLSVALAGMMRPAPLTEAEATLSREVDRMLAAWGAYFEASAKQIKSGRLEDVPAVHSTRAAAQRIGTAIVEAGYHVALARSRGDIPASARAPRPLGGDVRAQDNLTGARSAPSTPLVAER